MTNAEKVERRAVMCWRILVDLNGRYPSAGAATFEDALRPNGPTLATYDAGGGFTPEIIEAINLAQRMLREGVIEGEDYVFGVDGSTIPASIRRGLSKRDPNGSMSIIDSVEAALAKIDGGGTVNTGEFTRWAREAGFEP